MTFGGLETKRMKKLRMWNVSPDTHLLKEVAATVCLVDSVVSSSGSWLIMTASGTLGAWPETFRRSIYGRGLDA